MVELSCQVESPQSVVQGSPAQGSAVGGREKGALIGSIGEICGRTAVGRAWPVALSRHARNAGASEAWFLDLPRPTESLRAPRI
jgi:hypothetical protein